MCSRRLLKKGAESELYVIKWGDSYAISKIRLPKKYRHISIDVNLRKKRTMHETYMMSAVKFLGINAPFVYFLDLDNFEIIMEYVEGDILKDVFSSNICTDIGKIIGTLHYNNIIHGDITTSNFIIKSDNTIFIIDFGLSFFSERFEDKAADIRLFKEILNSIHVDSFDQSFDNFFQGYSTVYGNRSSYIFDTVQEIEKRGRYSRSCF